MESDILEISITVFMPGALPPQADRRAQREDHAVGGVAVAVLAAFFIHAPDVAEELEHPRLRSCRPFITEMLEAAVFA